MRKIVFFDIDGTLVDEQLRIPDSAKEAIRALQNNGVYTAIATGRAPFMIPHLLEELHIDSYVCFNGQYAVFEGELIYANPIKNDELGKFVEIAKDYGHSMVYMNETTLKANVKNDIRVAKSLGALNLPHPKYDPNFFEGNEIYQALLFATKEEAPYLQSFKDISFIRWHEYVLDVIPKGGSKAEGIQQLIQRLDLNMKDVYAFGDGMNDIEMLQAVGIGVAMGNAPEAVKKHADLITTDVGDHGIMKGLKEVDLLPSSFYTVGKK